MTVRRIALTATLVAAGLVPVLAGQDAAVAAPPSLCAPPADTVGPTATSVAFGRPSIDLDSGSRRQTVTVHASDTSGAGTASGVDGVRIEIRVGRFYLSPRLTLVSGTPAAGVWRAGFVVSKYAHAGTSTVQDLDVIDRAGNEQDYPGVNYAGSGATPASPDALSLHPALDTGFTVTGTPATPPRGKPAGTLERFGLSPTQVDTRAAGRHVRIAARFAGRSPAGAYARLTSTGSGRTKRFVFLPVRLHEHHGVWRGQVLVPRWLGTQRLSASLFVRYPSGLRPRTRDYDAARLHHLHFPSHVAVVSGVDRSKPKLTSVSFSPDPIDSTSGPERVTVTAHATDTGSGVRSIVVDAGTQHGINGVASGSYPYGGAGIGFGTSADLRFRLHHEADGSWRGSTTVPRCVPSGTYKLSAFLTDKAHNYRSYGGKQLAAAHVTSTVAVTSEHGDVEAPYVYSAATYGAKNELFLNFSEGVQNVTTTTLSVFALSPGRTRYESAAPVSRIVCSDGKRTVDCSGAGGLVTSAILIVPSMKTGHQYQIWGNLDQVVPQLTDGNRNALDWDDVQAEVRDS